jgi:O-antigen/teichoic acid export membrane protein
MVILGTAIKSIGHIILVPLFIAAWGKALYGEWLTLFSLVSYLSLSEMGMGTYVSNRMIQAYSGGKVREYAKIFKSAFMLYLLLASIGLIILLAIAFFLPFTEWLDISITDQRTAFLSFLLLGGYVIVTVLSSPIGELYTTVGEFVRSKIVANVREVALIGFVALTLLQGGNFVNVASVYLVILILFFGFIFWDARRRHKEIDLSKEKADLKLAKTFLIPGLLYMLIPLADIITVQGPVLIISSTIGSAAVATFIVHRTVANLISRATASLHPAVLPEITAAEKRKDYSKVQLMYSFFLKTSLFLSLSATAFLMFVGGDVLRIWVGQDIKFEPLLWLTLLILVPITNLWRFSSTFQIATNKYGGYAKLRLVFSVLGIIFGFILFQWLNNIAGIILGILLMEFILGIWIVPHQTLRIIKEDRLTFLKTLFLAAPMFIAQLGAAFLIDNIDMNIWLKFISIGLAITVVGGLYTLLLWFNTQEKRRVANFISLLRKS